jgi:hypothetical protein
MGVLSSSWRGYDTDSIPDLAPLSTVSDKKILDTGIGQVHCVRHRDGSPGEFLELSMAETASLPGKTHRQGAQPVALCGICDRWMWSDEPRRIDLGVMVHRDCRRS